MQRKNLDVDPTNRKNPFPFATNKYIHRMDTTIYRMVYQEDTPKLYLEFVIHT